MGRYTRDELVDALAELPKAPYSRATLEAMEDRELVHVANTAGGKKVKAAAAVVGLKGRVDKLERELTDAGVVTNRPKRISFTPKSTLGCGPGDVSQFTEERFRAGNEEGGAATPGSGISFTPRSTLGEGPGDASRFDK